MASSSFILFAGGPQWQLATCAEDQPVQWQDVPAGERQADALKTALDSAGYTGEPILIALSQTRCMSSTLWTEGLPKNDAKAWLYRLEAELPVDAEQIVADFGPAGRIDGRACTLAVCADRVWLGGLIGELEKRSIAVGPVVPAALLAAQGQYTNKPPDELLLLAEPEKPSDTLNLLEIRAGRPLAWVRLSATVDEVQTHLEWQSLQSQPPDRVELLGVDSKLARQIGGLNGWKLHTHAGVPADRAVVAAVEILAARRKPLIDLRRGPLAVTDRWRMQRRAINSALAAAAILLLVITLTLFVRSWRYSAAADRDQQHVAELFRQTFPGWTMPGNVRAVVDAEHRRAFATAGADAAGGSALATLQDVLSRIPASGNVSIEKMTFSPTRFDLSGQLKSYEAADELASSLQGRGLESTPPEAHRQPDGKWSFAVSGTLPSARGGTR